MSTLLSYVQDSDKDVVNHLIDCITTGYLYQSNLILLGADEYIKNKIINELSCLTKIVIINESFSSTISKESKIIIVDEIFLLKFKNNQSLRDILNFSIKKISLKNINGINYAYCNRCNVIVFAESLDFEKYVPCHGYKPIALRKSKSYYLTQLKS